MLRNKFKNINEIYNITNITDEYIITKENSNYSKIYIYEIKPIILLDLSDEVKEKIILEYKECLRQINFDFQILIVNKKLNFDEYIQKINNNICDNKIYNEYLSDMKLIFKNENIFESLFYIIVKINDKQCFKVENVDNSLKILEKIGCKVERIKDKVLLETILNKGINKEW